MKIETVMDNGNFRLNITASNLQEAQAIVQQIVIPMYDQLGYEVEFNAKPKDTKKSRFTKL